MNLVTLIDSRRNSSSFDNVMYGCWISTYPGKMQRRSCRIRNNNFVNDSNSTCQNRIDIQSNNCAHSSVMFRPESSVVTKHNDLQRPYRNNELSNKNPLNLISTKNRKNIDNSVAINNLQRHQQSNESNQIIRLTCRDPSLIISSNGFSKIVCEEMVYYCFEMLLQHLARSRSYNDDISSYHSNPSHPSEVYSYSKSRRRIIPKNNKFNVPSRYVERHNDIPLISSFGNAVYPLFVTWRKGKEGRLRGCVGTFCPTKLSTGLKEYAINSALKDSRFSPITHEELPSLQCAVSILTDFEKADNCVDWEIGQHGIKIELTTDKGKKTATYLPEVASEQGWSHIQTIDSLLRKSGYKGIINPEVRNSLKITRYRSEKISRAYDEFIKATSSYPAAIVVQ
ncbi:hypothetical protein GJ496_009900 [Pomphorhynchus laevis]|nr:hypothetical protein GJ496_009900 [Pomphorhynchus laevis]